MRPPTWHLDAKKSPRRGTIKTASVPCTTASLVTVNVLRRLRLPCMSGLSGLLTRTDLRQLLAGHPVPNKVLHLLKALFDRPIAEQVAAHLPPIRRCRSVLSKAHACAAHSDADGCMGPGNSDMAMDSGVDDAVVAAVEGQVAVELCISRLHNLIVMTSFQRKSFYRGPSSTPPQPPGIEIPGHPSATHQAPA